MMNSPMSVDSPTLSLDAVHDHHSMVMNNRYQHLSIQYESLAAEYTTIELEKKEYEEYIETLQQKNEALMEDNKIYKELINAEEQIKPVLSLQMHSYQSSLRAIDSERDILSEKVEDYGKLIKTLTAENHEMTETNEKYKEALENINKQKENLQHLHQQQNQSQLHHIETLETENHALKQEIIALKQQMFVSQELNDEKYHTSSKTEDIYDVEHDQQSLYHTSPSFSNRVRRIGSVSSLSATAHHPGNRQKTPFSSEHGSPHHGSLHHDHHNALLVGIPTPHDSYIDHLLDPSFPDLEHSDHEEDEEEEEVVEIGEDAHDDLMMGYTTKIEGLQSELADCHTEIVKLKSKLKLLKKHYKSKNSEKGFYESVMVTVFGGAYRM